MDIFNIAGIAVIVAAIAVLLRQNRKEYAMLVSLGAGIIILVYVILKAVPAFTVLQNLLSGSGVNSEYIKILLKSLGICFIAQLASDACRDAGETAIASKVELAGKFAVLLVALPLFEQVAKLVTNLIAS